MKKRSLLAKLLVMLLCFALVFSGCKGGDKDGGNSGEDKTPKTPAAQLSYSADKTIGAVFANAGAANVFEDALKMGKITLEYQDILNNVLYIDSGNKYFADFLNVNVSGSEIEGEVYYKDGALAVMLPDILGSDAIGIDINTLKEDLKNSALWDMLGISYEDFLSAYEIDMDKLTESLVGTLDSLGTLEATMEDASKGVEMKSEEKKVTVDGEEVDAIVVTVKLTSNDIKKMLLSYVDWLMDVYKETLDNMDDSIGSIDVNEMIDLDSSIGQYKTQIEDSFADIDLTIESVVNIHADTEYMMSIQMDITGKVNGEDGAIHMNMNLGKNPSASDKFTMSIAVESEGEEKGQVDAVLSKTKNGSVTETKLVVTVTEEGETNEAFNATLNYNSASYAYNLNVTVDGDDFAVNGTFKYTDDVFELSVDKVINYGEEQVVDVLVRIEAEDNMPQMPAYKNILKMTQDELTDFFGNVA